MADNVAITAGSGVTVHADEYTHATFGAGKSQLVKITWGPPDTGNDTDVASGKPFPVQLRGSDGTDRSNLMPVSLAAETTKVIGTVNVAAAQTLATVTTVSAVTAITNALPAGTNAIGKLSANSGVDIGDVDVTSVPTDPFGANADVASATGSISAKLRFIAGTGIPITGTVTVGSHAVTNAGTFLVQENGAAATSLALIDDTITAQGTALGSVKTNLQGGSVTTAAPTYTTGQISPLSLDTAGALRVTGAGGGTQYTEDVAAAADPVGNALMAVRRDTLSASEVSADGDNIAIKATSKGQVHTHASLWDGTNALTLVQDTASTSAWAVPVMIHPDSSGVIADVAHDAADSGGIGPLKIGGYAKAAAPTDVSADADRVNAWFLRNGAMAVNLTAAGALIGGDATNGLKVQSPKGLANKIFVTTFATLTRPANVTPYTAADSISDNATAGSVTALVSGNISDVNDDPIFLSEILVTSTDTGLAGKKIRAYLFNTDPTASSGVGGGDNVAFSQKKAGYIGSFMGYLETGFSDGTVGRLVPTFNETNFTQAGGFIPALPVSGARTLYIQYQAVEAFTPSANSTTIIGTAKGWQGRAV